jgi:hypothetical protein
MTRAEINDWWAKRGDARDALANAERALLYASEIAGQNDIVGAYTRKALGSIAGAQALLDCAFEIVERRAKDLP